MSGHLRNTFLLLVSMLVAGFSACSTTPVPYMERYRVEALTVVLLDEHSLRKEWEAITGRKPTRFLSTMRNGMPSITTVRGFYDFATDTLYCPKWDYEVCGHELHHAILGAFHQRD